MLKLTSKFDSYFIAIKVQSETHEKQQKQIQNKIKLLECSKKTWTNKHMSLNPFRDPEPHNHTKTCQHPMELLLYFYRSRI